MSLRKTIEAVTIGLLTGAIIAIALVKPIERPSAMTEQQCLRALIR